MLFRFQSGVCALGVYQGNQWQLEAGRQVNQPLGFPQAVGKDMVPLPLSQSPPLLSDNGNRQAVHETDAGDYRTVIAVQPVATEFYKWVEDRPEIGASLGPL